MSRYYWLVYAIQGVNRHYVWHWNVISNTGQWVTQSQTTQLERSSLFFTVSFLNHRRYMAVTFWQYFRLVRRPGNPCYSLSTMVYPPARGRTSHLISDKVTEYCCRTCSRAAIRIPIHRLDPDSLSPSQVDRMAGSGCYYRITGPPTNKKVGAGCY